METVEPTYITITPAASLLLDAYRSVNSLGWQLAKLADDGVITEPQADEIDSAGISLEKVEGYLARAFCLELIQGDGREVVA